MPTRLSQLRIHVDAIRGCTACPRMHGPAIAGDPIVSPVMLIGQAPGPHEAKVGKPFGWTAGKTLFGWFGGIGLDEAEVRRRVYIAAVCRCFPGKDRHGGDRVPDPAEISRCSHHLVTEVGLVQPRLLVPVGKLAIAQVLADAGPLAGVVGRQLRARYHGRDVDVIPLPHPSGASTWHRMEPGKSLLATALATLAAHPAWRELIAAAAPRPRPAPRARRRSPAKELRP